MFREEAERGSINVDVRLLKVKKTKEGAVATIKVKAGPWEARHNVYFREGFVILQFYSADVDRVYQMAHVLRLLGVKTEPKKVSDRDVWHIKATTDALASKEVLPAFREKLARAVEEAAQKGWIKAEAAERWAKKLRAGVTSAEDKPKFGIWITNRGGLNIVYRTTSDEKLAQYAEQLKSLGLKKGVHFTKEEPNGNKEGRLAITVEGVVKLAELAYHAEDEATRLKAAEWVRHLLARAEESSGNAARRMLEELVREGAARGGRTLTGLRREVEVDGERHVVEVKQAKAWIGEEDDKLRIHVKAVVDGVEVERTYTFFRERGATYGYVSVLADVPGGARRTSRG